MLYVGITNEGELQIPYVGWQRPYTIDLADLPQGPAYEVRVKAIDRNRSPSFVSPSVTLQSSRSCSPPRSPPRSITVSPLGPTQIRLSWQVTKLLLQLKLNP